MDPVPLKSEHLDDARLYADRFDMIRKLKIPNGGAVAEIGVFRGDFSEFLIDTLSPKQFFAYDLFDMSPLRTMWDKPIESYFDGLGWKAFYGKRFEKKPTKVTMVEGPTSETLTNSPSDYFDLVYVDAGHSYEDVSRDAKHALRMVKRDGVVVFNDYIMTDHLYNTPYGVVHAVNEIVAEGLWKVVGLALNSHMFCDVALKQIQSDPRRQNLFKLTRWAKTR
jgi:methyltransferase family protein